MRRSRTGWGEEIKERVEKKRKKEEKSAGKELREEGVKRMGYWEGERKGKKIGGEEKG